MDELASNLYRPANTGNDQPGFKYEVVMKTNFQVAIFNVDGVSNPGANGLLNVASA